MFVSVHITICVMEQIWSKDFVHGIAPTENYINVPLLQRMNWSTKSYLKIVRFLHNFGWPHKGIYIHCFDSSKYTSIVI